MNIDHRTLPRFSRYLLLSLASSAAVQIAQMWPQMWVLIGAIALVGLSYIFIFSLRYWGLLKGARWAHQIRIEHLDGGALDFINFASFILIGGLGTWLLYST